MFFPGLFSPHYGRDKNLPIVRTGTIAAMPLEKLPVRYGYIDAYLVQARSIAGLSGSPVFVRMDPRKADEHWARRVVAGPTPKYGLLGLIRGHFEAEAEKDATADAINAEAFNMGIGIVVPVEKIVETLLHPEFVEKYDEIETRFKRESPPGTRLRRALALSVNKIGSITPAGLVTEFVADPTVPGGENSRATGITAGSDGNLWFTTGYSAAIGA